MAQAFAVRYGQTHLFTQKQVSELWKGEKGLD